MANRIQQRRDTAANWTSANPILAVGEPGYETDTKKSKIGDGTTAWTALSYQAPNEDTLNATFVNVVTGLNDDDSTDNRAIIQAALDLGGTVILPPTAGRYAIAGTLVMDVPGTELICTGAPMRQATVGMTLIDVIAADCAIVNLDVEGVPGEPDMNGLGAAWQGSSIASRWTGVNIYASAHRLHIPWIRGRGMSSVVRVSGWDAITNALATNRVQDVEIGTLLCERVEFGIAAKGTERIKIGSVRGSYGQVLNYFRQLHLLYFADDGNHHVMPSIGDCAATDGLRGQAYQLKGVQGGMVGKLQATNCPGILTVMECTDMSVAGLRSLNDTYADVAASLMVDAVGTNARLTFGPVHIQMLNDYPAVLHNVGTDDTFESITVVTAHDVTGASTVYDVDIRGTRTTVEKVTVDNTGGVAAWKAVAAWAGSGHVFKSVVAKNVRVGIDTRNTNAVVYYNPDLTTLHAVDGLSKATAASGAGAKFYTQSTIPLMADRAVLVADNFSLPSGTAKTLLGTPTGHAWAPLTGTWAVDGETLRTYETGGAANGATVVDAGQSNVSVEAFFTSLNSEGLVLRATDASNYLAVRLHRTGSNIDLMKRVAGVNTVIATMTTPTTSGRRYRLRADIYGAEVKVYLDGVLVLTHTLTGGDETTFASQTKHGLRSNVSTTARFDSFRVLSLS